MPVFKNLDVPYLEDQQLECIWIPWPTALVRYLRLFFTKMQEPGIYLTEEDARRGIDYFSEIEAAMLQCSNTTEELKENQNQNFCSLVAILVPILTEGAIPPPIAMLLCNTFREAFQKGEGSPEWENAENQIPDLREAGVDNNTANKLLETIGKIEQVLDAVDYLERSMGYGE